MFCSSVCRRHGAATRVDDFQSSTGTYDSANRVGYLIGGSGTAVRRGGQDTDFDQPNPGIYGINFNRNITGDRFPSTGFRCVMRL
jgi:hypothetical protein